MTTTFRQSPIVKWWKNKFNRYRNINGVSPEDFCARSDTETLVRAYDDDMPVTPSSRGRGSSVTSSRPSSFPPVGNIRQDLSRDINETWTDEGMKKEFAFTLYDLDGHGRVTKEDINGLVETIYDAVGTSLALPSCGSRTIRINLSVDEPQQHEVLMQLCCNKEEAMSPATGDCRRRRRRKRSMSLHRQELLEIIRANMEKNHLYYSDSNTCHRCPVAGQRAHRCPPSEGSEGSGAPDPLHISPYTSHTHYHNHNHISDEKRSRSQDATRDSPHIFPYHLLDQSNNSPLPPSNTPDRPNHNSHSHCHNSPHRSRHSKRRHPPLLEPLISSTPIQPPTFTTSSPQPELKHRHRDWNHSRAMAQVTAWLDHTSFRDQQHSDDAFISSTHHTHQHVHHHYHHYTDPPALL